MRVCRGLFHRIWVWNEVGKLAGKLVGKRAGKRTQKPPAAQQREMWNQRRGVDLSAARRTSDLAGDLNGDLAGDWAVD